MSSDQSTVLLCEDNESSDGFLRKYLEQLNIKVLACTDGIDAVRKSFMKNPDLIILDVTAPRLNGYQAARLLKNDPNLSSTPIVHMGPPSSAIGQYWSRLCRGDGYLDRPISERKLNEMLERYLDSRVGTRQLFAPVSVIQDLEDNSILTMANALMEQDLVRANILNEISMVDIWTLLPRDVVTSLMSIIGSLYDFSTGAALLVYEHDSEFLFYQNGSSAEDRLKEIKGLVLKHLEHRFDIHLDPQAIRQTLLQAIRPTESKKRSGEVYIHTEESGPIRSVLAFEDIQLDRLRSDEQEILGLALKLAHGVLEKKIFFQMSQELSIIDAVTAGHSIAFFMSVLEKEIENTRRNGYPMTLFTISVTNARDLTRDPFSMTLEDLVRTIQRAIMKTVRKADIVARWETTSFAFLLPHTTLGEARGALQRIAAHIMKSLVRFFPSANQIKMNVGIRQFDPDQDGTAEAFFDRARPRQTIGNNYLEDSIPVSDPKTDEEEDGEVASGQREEKA
jgi:two-component system cell cycle response regulator DivK